MKTLIYICLSLFIFILFCGCENKKIAENKISVENEISKENEISIKNEISAENEITINEDTENFDTSSFSVNTINTYDFFTEHVWFLEDGRYLVDPSVGRIDWIGPKAPLVFFEKFYIPSNRVLYQVRLRKERFYFEYQTEEDDKLFPFASRFGTEAYNIEFRDNYSSMTLRRNGTSYGRQNRAGQQINPDYPIVGIWGVLPYLTEYRIIDPADCLYYIEINKDIPGYAVREGTYLLKQTGDNTFETISSFPDSYMKLEIINENRLLLTPLFTLPEDEEGWVAPLIVHRSILKSELVIEEY